METFLRYLLAAVAAYLLGSINFAIIISKIFAGTDIREHGSGNAGGTNMFRLLGAKAGVLTGVLDMLKALTAVFLGKYVFMGGKDILAAALAGLLCIIGHMYPVFFRFKGGKGVAAALGMALMLNPLIALCLLALFCVIVLITGYVSLGSVVAAAFFSLSFAVFYRGNPNMIWISGLLILTGALIIWAHRANIKRLISGTEKRILRGKIKGNSEKE